MNRFLTADDIFEPAVQNKLIVWKSDGRFFSLASHALWVCEAHTICVHETFTLPLRYTKLILREKVTACLQSSLMENIKTSLFPVLNPSFLYVLKKILCVMII